MSNPIVEAQLLLESIQGRYPFRLNEVTGPTENFEVIGTLRDAYGLPVVSPHFESVSMLTGTREMLEFLRDAPVVLANLLASLEATAVVPAESAETEAETL